MKIMMLLALLFLFSSCSEKQEINKGLFQAVEAKNSAKVKELMLKGADANILNNKGESPLYIAVKNNDPISAGYLLGEAISFKEKNIADIYFKHEKTGNNLFHEAFKHNNIDLIILLSKHINYYPDNYGYNKKGVSAYDLAKNNLEQHIYGSAEHIDDITKIDINRDGILDYKIDLSYHVRYNAGSYNEIILIDGKTKEYFYSDFNIANGYFISLIPIPEKLLIKENKSFLDYLENKFLAGYRKEAKADNLLKCFIDYHNNIYKIDSKIINNIVLFDVNWQNEKPPERKYQDYYIRLSEKEMKQFVLSRHYYLEDQFYNQEEIYKKTGKLVNKEGWLVYHLDEDYDPAYEKRTKLSRTSIFSAGIKQEKYRKI